ncbi:MAG: bifunctional 5,10-methylenetetrahydrofolate dehydrogenase/5,10-methenyltetrahydrofolate cyclohydrolase [Patescibacteria group bacterium]
MVKIIDGKKIAEKVFKEVKARLRRVKHRPKLAVVLIGDDPASKIYVNMKIKACNRLGIESEVVQLSRKEAEEMVEKEKSRLEREIERLDADETVTGILVQLPLPGNFSSDKIIAGIDPEKDVDCLHPQNLGRFMMGTGRIAPCASKGCLRLLDEYGIKIAGKEAVVVGKSKIVGRPMSRMLLARGARVLSCDKSTKNLAQCTKRADILVSAAGEPRLIRKEMVKKGAVVIDVGTTREKTGSKKKSAKGKLKRGLIGDVCFDEVSEVASAITPVPGGVGPMTVAMLMENVVILAENK